MAQIIYLMNTTILMSFKRLEHFLMNVEVIFLVKEQMKLEKNFTKKEVIYNFLKDKEQMVV